MIPLFKPFLAGVALAISLGALAQTGDKIVIAHRVPAVTCRNTPCPPKRWRMHKGRTIWSRTW